MGGPKEGSEFGMQINKYKFKKGKNHSIVLKYKNKSCEQK